MTVHGPRMTRRPFALPSAFTLLMLMTSLALLLAAPDSARAQATEGLVRFEVKCASCHQNAAANAPKAPDAAKLRRMSAEAVYAALDKAPHTQIPDLPDEDKRLIAAYLGGRKIGIAEISDAKMMPNRCTTNDPMGDLAASPIASGWGLDPTTNARYQPASAAGLTADQVPKLKLKWAFGFPGADEAWSQPAVAAGRLFVGSDAGTVYALDAATGCVYWSFQAEGGMRNAINIAPVEGPGLDQVRSVLRGHAARTCTAWTRTPGSFYGRSRVDDNPVAQITGSPHSTKADCTSPGLFRGDAPPA